MEYYPIYFAIKTWAEKRPFLALFLFCLAIIIPSLHYIEKPETSIAGATFEETLLSSGIHEITFKFDKDIVKLDTHENNIQQWLDIMDLSFDPPQEGSIRTISGDSFSYIFNTPIIEDTKIYYNDSVSSNVTIHHQQSTSSPFLLKKNEPQIFLASQNNKDAETSIMLFANQPLQLSSVKKGVTLTTLDNKKIQFMIDYDIATNTTINKTKCIKTNFDTFRVVSSLLKTDTKYVLGFDYNSIDIDKENFKFEFLSYSQPAWKNISQNSLFVSSHDFIVNEPLWILHNNLITTTNTTNSILTVTPEVSNLSYTIHQQGIQISGDFDSEKTYSLTFTPIDLSDEYGQAITSDFNTTFTLVSRAPYLQQVQGVLYVDRDNPIVRYQTVNVTNVTITYQLVTSPYYTAVSLSGRSVPVDTFRTNFTIDSPKDRETWQEFDISNFLTNRALLVLMNIQDANNPSTETNFTKVLATTSSFMAHISTEDLLIQVKDIKTQEPHELMMISIWDPARGSFQDLGRTKSDGTLRVPYPKLPLKTLQNPVFIGMFEGRALFDHVAFLTPQDSYLSSQDTHFYSSAQLFHNDIASTQYIKAMISTDRPSYQFGEDVHVHILARAKTNNNYTSKHEFFDTLTQIKVLDSEQKIITNFHKRWSSMGAIDFGINKDLIKKIGTYSIQVDTPSQNFHARDYFVVGSLKKRAEEILFDGGTSVYRFGENLDITLEPKFLFGANINSHIEYSILGIPIDFHSKKYPHYYFGGNTPQESEFLIKGQVYSTPEAPIVSIQDTLKGNNNLKLYLYAKADTDSTAPISLENHSINVFNPIQLGIRNYKISITNCELLEFDLIAIDPITEDIIQNNATFSITKERVLDLGVFSFITNYIPITPKYEQTLLHQNIYSGESTVPFTPKEEGVYKAEYKSFYNGVQISTSISFVVMGATPQIGSRLSIELDKNSYVSGEQAIVYIENPFEYGELLLIIEKDTIREYHYIAAMSDIITQPIPLTFQDEPGLNVTAILSSDSSILYGTTSINIEPTSKKLQISAQMSKSNYMPQEEVTIDLSAYNSFNQLMDGEALVIVRDRSVLDDSIDSIEDPVEYFYSHREKGFSTWNSLRLSLDNQNISNVHPHYLRTMQYLEPLPTIRSNFPYTIYYKGDISISKNKKNTVSFTLPDNISSFNVTVIMHDGEQLFGKTNLQITSSKKLMVEDILPKFLRPNDQVVWGAYIRNFTQKELSTTVLLDNNESSITQEVLIPTNSFVLITNTTTISKKQTNWNISAVSENYHDSILKNVPIIDDTPWISSSYANILNYRTNITIPSSDATQQSLYLQIATTPDVKYELQELFENDSLSLDVVAKRLSVFLAYENLILSNYFITNTREQLRLKIQKDLDSLKSYYSNDSRILLVPNSGFYSYDSMYLLQVYEILLSARQNNYFIDTTLLDNLSTTALIISSNSEATSYIRAYALNILATYKIIDKEVFDYTYPLIVFTPDAQALILDTMHKLGYPLKTISTQTERIYRYTSETSSSVLVNSRFLARVLILYYGTYSDGIKILNSQPNDLLSTLAFLSKYPKQDSYTVDANINNKTYKLSDSTNSLTMPIDTSGINITLQTDNTNSLFYNIVYSHIPQSVDTPINSGYSLTKKIIDIDTKEEVLTLEKNKRYTVELTINSKLTGSQQVEIIDPLYAGTKISQDGLISSDDKVYLYTTVSGTTPKNISYQITATHRGVWTASPSSVKLLKSPESFGIQPQSSITIK